MGEATYYLKARFPEGKLTEELFNQIKAFFIEGSKAEDFWQENRDWQHKEAKTPEDFWKVFKENFPIVSEYLDTFDRNEFCGSLGKTKIEKGCSGDFNNSLAGLLDFGSVEDIELQLSMKGDILSYSAEIWHFSEWGYLVIFLKSKFGATSADYISDENIDPSELINI